MFLSTRIIVPARLLSSTCAQHIGSKRIAIATKIPGKINYFDILLLSNNYVPLSLDGIVSKIRHSSV
jgi:hypothetical protein